MAATRICALHRRIGADLCRRHLAEHHCMGVGHGAVAAGNWSGRGRPPKLTRRDRKHQPISVKQLALGLPKRAWRTIAWREGSADSCPRALPGCASCRPSRLQSYQGRPEEWLLIEWPKGEAEPTKYWLSTLPKNIPFHRGRPHQTTLAHRARLSGAETGGRARPLRRARMARLPSSRHTLHRGLRIPDLRTGDDFPLRTSSRRDVPGICHSRRLPTQRLRRCGLNGTSRTRLQPCVDDCSRPRQNLPRCPCCDAPIRTPAQHRIS